MFPTSITNGKSQAGRPPAPAESTLFPDPFEVGLYLRCGAKRFKGRILPRQGGRLKESVYFVVAWLTEQYRYILDFPASAFHPSHLQFWDEVMFMQLIFPHLPPAEVTGDLIADSKISSFHSNLENHDLQWMTAVK